MKVLTLLLALATQVYAQVTVSPTAMSLGGPTNSSLTVSAAKATSFKVEIILQEISSTTIFIPKEVLCET